MDYPQQTHKKYKCMVCGNVQEIKTNHYYPCFEYCHKCSWKGVGFDLHNYTAQLFGHAYRQFECIELEGVQGA